MIRALALLPVLLFQGSLLKPAAIQHVTAVASSAPDSAAAAGKVTLALDVTPQRNIHVYAPGAKDFVATALKLTPQPGLNAGKPVYPPSESVLDPILNERIPEYVKPFRITQPIVVPTTVKSGQTLSISGVLSYQACDDKMCFPPSELSVSWAVKIR